MSEGGLHLNTKFIENHTLGLNELKLAVKYFDEKTTTDITGLTVESLNYLCDLIKTLKVSLELLGPKFLFVILGLLLNGFCGGF